MARRPRSAMPVPTPPSASSDDGDVPLRDECEAALVRVTESVAFKGSPRLAAFLRFVADAVLSGRSESIKAYTVAVGALGRPVEFDPVADASVRVEAGRLRRALARYYESADDPVLITMPRGGYVPEFRRRGAAAQPASGDVEIVSQFLAAMPELSATKQRHVQLREQHRRERETLTRNIATLRVTIETIQTILTSTQEMTQEASEEAAKPLPRREN